MRTRSYSSFQAPPRQRSVRQAEGRPEAEAGLQAPRPGAPARRRRAPSHPAAPPPPRGCCAGLRGAARGSGDERCEASAPVPAGTSHTSLQLSVSICVHHGRNATD